MLEAGLGAGLKAAWPIIGQVSNLSAALHCAWPAAAIAADAVHGMFKIELCPRFPQLLQNHEDCCLIEGSRIQQVCFAGLAAVADPNTP